MGAGPGPVKVAGLFLLAALWFVSAVGASGLVRLAAERIAGMEDVPTGFGALAKGAGIIVLAAMVPILGWLAITPLLLLVSFGAGLQAVFMGGAVSSSRRSAEFLGEGIR